MFRGYKNLTVDFGGPGILIFSLLHDIVNFLIIRKIGKLIVNETEKVVEVTG